MKYVYTIAVLCFVLLISKVSADSTWYNHSPIFFMMAQLVLGQSHDCLLWLPHFLVTIWRSGSGLGKQLFPPDLKFKQKKLWRKSLPDFCYASSATIALQTISQRVYELIIEILLKRFLFWLWIWWSCQVTILRMSQQLSCRDMCKIVTWFNHYFPCKSNLIYFKIWIVSSQTLCEMVVAHRSTFIMKTFVNWISSAE